MSQPDARSRRAWRVRGQLQDYLLLKRSDLTEEEANDCVPSVFIVAELDRWLASVFARRICYDLYEVVTGTALDDLLLHRPPVDPGQLKRRIAEAFRNGRLAALPLGPIRARRSGGGGAGAPSSPPAEVPLLAEVPLAADQTKKTEETDRPKKAEETGQELAWVALELVDEDGNPVSDVRYLIVLPDGSKREGRLDSNGRARIDDVAPGSCQISFPDLDGDSWALSAR